MSFYDEIKSNYCKYVDEETGLLKTERKELEGICHLLRYEALNATKKGQNKITEEVRLYSDSQYTLCVDKKKDIRVRISEADAAHFLIEHWPIEKDQAIIRAFVKKELGEEFIFDISLDNARSKKYAKLKLSWPLPSKEEETA